MTPCQTISANATERPALAATLTRDVTPEGPVAVKLALDYSLLSLHELVQFRALIEKAMPRQTDGSEPLMIEGEAAAG